ncbi:MAG: Tlg2-vesicle protein [Candelina submexicana]|nr:MAG: Tlg2-vesicle protein [Candelina submexicana]
MPADYNSTARALALPISPTEASSPFHQPARPQWGLPRLSSEHSHNRSPYAHGGETFREKMLHNAEQLQRQVVKTVKKMSLLQRVLAGIALVVALVLTILFLIFNEAIFAWLVPVAEKWKKVRGGWTILWLMTFLTAFPPVIGYSTCVTIAGFVYGFKGWFIAATATVIGSLCSFLASRTILSRCVQRLVAEDRRFSALSLTIKHDGLKLLVLIRLCPLPYSISNGAMSTLPTVSPLSYALATAIITPKLLIHIFIGTRLAALAKSGGKMDTGTKLINYASIAFSAILGAATAWFIYQRTMARAQELEDEERANPSVSASPTQRTDSFSDDPEDEGAASMLRDEDMNDVEYGADAGDYRDDFTDGDDIFRHGDGEGGSIGLGKQSR